MQSDWKGGPLHNTSSVRSGPIYPLIRLSSPWTATPHVPMDSTSKTWSGFQDNPSRTDRVIAVIVATVTRGSRPIRLASVLRRMLPLLKFQGFEPEFEK